MTARAPLRCLIVDDSEELLAARAPATRVILISSYGVDDLADLIAHSPAAGFLPKTDLGAAAIERLLA